jgi:hypothetical protein
VKKSTLERRPQGKGGEPILGTLSVPCSVSERILKLRLARAKAWRTADSFDIVRAGLRSILCLRSDEPLAFMGGLESVKKERKWPWRVQK